MRRIQENDLDNWWRSPSRKPMILRGARQVGKSTLVRLFAQKNQLRLMEINLERKKNWNSLFASNDIQKILSEIEGLLDKKIDTSPASKDLIFFDECQATPSLLSCLRYFLEDLPQLAVIAAGSLLEFTLDHYDAPMPVGRIEFLHLHPMSFKEFLWAMGEDSLSNRLENFDFSSPLPLSTHEKALNYQRQYLFIGGMPEAIKNFALYKDPRRVRKIQSEILEVYRDDFNKYAQKQFHLRLDLVLDYALFHTGKKVKYSQISSDFEAKEIKKCIELLSKAKVITKVINTHSQGIPLAAGIDAKSFKFLFLDVGLINVGLKVDWNELLNITERELLNEGPLAEQFIGQHILHWQENHQQPEIHYWLRESKAQAAELDFLVQQGASLVAIEVKAGSSGAMRSLHQWNRDIKYKRKKSMRFDLNPPSKFKVKINDPALKYELLSLPLYLAAYNPLKLI
ncbi:MAG: ATP-binding protein [Pseudobdellovibrionaceae bacterium]